MALTVYIKQHLYVQSYIVVIKADGRGCRCGSTVQSLPTMHGTLGQIPSTTQQNNTQKEGCWGWRTFTKEKDQAVKQIGRSQNDPRLAK